MNLERWLDDAEKVLNKDFGLEIGFARKVALFFLYLFQYGLNPQITSGWRSPEHQKELLRRYENGDPSIVARPATNSKHCITIFNKPAAQAVDISTNNPALAAQIAQALKIGAGYYFKKSDPVHFYI